MSTFLRGIAVLACMLGIASAASAQDLVLGYSSSTTGPFASQAKRNSVAIEVAIEEINAAGGVNGKKIVLRSFDTGGKPEQAVVAVEQFAKDMSALAVIGPFSTSECRVAFPVGERLGISQMSMASSAPKVAAPFTYAFRNTVEENYSWERIFRTIDRKGYAHGSASIAYATDDSVSQSVGATVLPARLAAAGIPVTDTVTFRVNSFDLSAQVSEMMQKPSDIVGIGAPSDVLLRLLAELRRQGYKGRIVGGSSIADADLPERMGANGEGTLIGSTFYSGMEGPRVKSFVQSFKSKLKAAGEPDVEPSQFDAASYDIVYMYADAMKKAKVTGEPSKLAEERQAIRDAIRQMKDFPALVGSISMGKEGDVTKTIYILEAKANKWVVVDQHPD